MNGLEIAQKILFGYAKAAQHLGSPFLLYRSATPINPIAPGNLITTILANINYSWDYMTANKYGKNVSNILIDAQYANSPNAARVGDYIIGTTDVSGLPTNLNRYFIQALEADLPPQAVECNRTITIIRPTQSTGAGNQGYVGYTPATSLPVVTAMPVSMLIDGRGGEAKTKLPTDTRNPNCIIYMPNLGGVKIRIGDIITDDLNQSYVTKDNELTELGWRLRAEQVVNYR